MPALGVVGCRLSHFSHFLRPQADYELDPLYFRSH